MSFLSFLRRLFPKSAKNSPTRVGAPNRASADRSHQPRVVEARSSIAGAETLGSYSDIGNIRRVLTAGREGLYQVPPDLADSLIAIERQGTQGGSNTVWVLVPENADSSLQVSLNRELRQLLGALRVKGIAPKVLKTSGQVLAEVRKTIAQVDALAAQKASSSSLELFDQWIHAAAEANTSDIHILGYGSEAAVKFRLDNELVPLALPGFEKGIYSRTTVQRAVGAGYNYAPNSGSGGSQYSETAYCDAMLEREINGRRILLRYQNNPAAPGSAQFGAKTVIRFLYLDGAEVTSLDDGGYAPSHLKILREASRSGSGVIIFAGVTGSGKSTSIKLFVESIPGLHRMAVSTIEDPIEYLIAPGIVHQMQVTRDLADPVATRERFGQAIKALLRSDPDAVMIGEVRDELTARAALVLAETGHLALFSLHAHLISNIVGRLTNKEVGLSRDELTAPQILNTLVYQALVPKLCPHCAQTTDEAVTAAQQLAQQSSIATERHANTDDYQYLVETIDTLQNRFKIDTQRLKWRKVGGCEHCRHSGLKGRTIVAEVWQPDRVWLEHTRNHRDYEALLHYRSFSDGDFTSSNMNGKTVFEHCIYKALLGVIDVRSARVFESFSRYEFPPKHKDSKVVPLGRQSIPREEVAHA
jgi:general secretion pathway protein E